MKFSLVIPLQNEAASVRVLLESVATQTRHPDEIVVVDAGSEDGTAEIVKAAGASLPIRLLRRDRLTPGAARNEGAAAARFEWLAFTDGGIRLDPHWLEEIAVAVEQERAEVGLGSYEPVCDSFFRQCAAIAYVASRDDRGFRGPSTASIVLNRKVLEGVGGFPDLRAAEDLIFFERLREKGYREVLVPKAVVFWQLAGSVTRTFQRFALYSDHNLRAGRGRFWHFGVLRSYLVLGFAGAVSAWIGGFPWLVAATALWLLGRAGKAAWAKRRSFSFSTLHPARILGTGAVLVLLDAATAVGALRFYVRRAKRS